MKDKQVDKRASLIKEIILLNSYIYKMNKLNIFSENLSLDKKVGKHYRYYGRNHDFQFDAGIYIMQNTVVRGGEWSAGEKNKIRS